MSSRPSGPRKGQRPTSSGRIANEQRLLALGDAVERRHGAIFDVTTGEALSLPATEPVATYGVSIVNGVVYLDEEWS